jgi:hypothetical protein
VGLFHYVADLVLQCQIGSFDALLYELSEVAFRWVQTFDMIRFKTQGQCTALFLLARFLMLVVVRTGFLQTLVRKHFYHIDSICNYALFWIRSCYWFCLQCLLNLFAVHEQL